MIIKFNPNKIKRLIFVVLLLCIIVNPVYAITSLFDQTLSFRDPHTIDIKFVSSETNVSSARYYFPKSWNLQNFTAHNSMNNESLNLTFNETNDLLYVNIQFPGYFPPPEQFGLVFEAVIKDRTQQLGSDVYSFYWGWGNASYPLPLRVTYKLPINYELNKVFSGNASNVFIENGREIIVFEDTVHPNTYLESGVIFSMFKEPKLEVTNRIDKSDLFEGENLAVTIDIYNQGKGIAKNINVTVVEPSTFTILKTANLIIEELAADKKTSLTFIYSSTTPIVNEKIQPTMVVYENKFGKKYQAISNSEVVTVKREKVLGLIDPSYIVTAVITSIITLLIYRLLQRRR